MYNEIYFHFVAVYLFPLNDYAVIHFVKSGYQFGQTTWFDIKTERKVPFDYAVNYLIRHGMKMEQDKEYKLMFKARKG